MPKNALKMLYLIVHFQKNFMGEAPGPPAAKKGVLRTHIQNLPVSPLRWLLDCFQEDSGVVQVAEVADVMA